MAFVGENVKGLLTTGNGQIMPAVVQAVAERLRKTLDERHGTKV